MRLIKDETGLSLVETVAASVILLVVLLPMLSTLLNSHKIVFMSRDKTVAGDLLIQAAEQVKTTAFGAVYTAPPAANYQGSKFTLNNNVTSINSKLKRVDLAIYDGTRLINGISFILYEKGL